ncbi:MAG: pyridoxal-phosphate dependent enzyme [Candidatus Hydrogenedentes bacterium]|nr:pyridoxal-phosphate dependent enzyme [Candidatus Hydrogenedentota bacterium]
MNMDQPAATFHLHCYQCGHTAPLDAPFTCPACGDPLSLRPVRVDAPPRWETPRTMWDYGALLPIRDPGAVVTLGEGATPLVHAEHLAAKYGFGEVRLKNEMTNPTGSFKDRQISVGISRARELGRDTVAVVSSGNVAAAAAAYAAKAGMRAVLFMHGQAGQGKIRQAAIYGATVLCVDSPAPSRVFELCLEACSRWGWYHLSTAGMYEPYNVEGAKTIAYELYQQYGGELPDYVVAPVGGGGLLGGLWRGLLDLQRMGLVAHVPKLVGVQAAGCAPFPQALEQGWSFQESLKHPWPDPETVAGGIADDIIFDGHTALPAIRSTGGKAITVTDDAIMAGLHLLAEREGLLCEPTCAPVIAALEELGGMGKGARVCCIVTGNGIKELPYLKTVRNEPVRVAATMEAISDALKKT